MSAWKKSDPKMVDRLPEIFLEDTIAKMRVGDAGWSVPWAMGVDADRKCWLDPAYTVHDSPGGTVEMRISRTSDGYVVEVPRTNRWLPRECRGWLPVFGLVIR